jgi:hypothetical protein
MEIKKRLIEIANLLYTEDYDGVIYFDHKSYDDDNDIPRLNIDNEIVKVEQFVINRDGTLITIVDDKCYGYTLDMVNLPDGWDDSMFEEIGMFDLIRDVYYETKESWEIGDYESDFISNNN